VDVNERTLGTPLKVAATRGNEAVALVLIAHGASIVASSGTGTMPLHAAAEADRLSMVELLIERGADVNARSVSTIGTPSYSPMHSAGQGGHFDIIDLLRAYGAKGVSVR
jgi:ankyrin repeat protein